MKDDQRSLQTSLLFHIGIQQKMLIKNKGKKILFFYTLNFEKLFSCCQFI